MGTVGRPAIGSSRERRHAYGGGRQALIDATIRIVARDGLTALTTRALTAEAGVSQGNLQHHFGTVDEAVLAAIEQCIRETLDYVTPPERLENIFDGILAELADRTDASVFQTVIFLEARTRPELLDVVTRYHELYSQNLRDVLIALALPVNEDLVQLLMAIGDGIAYEYAIFGTTQLHNVRIQLRALRALLTPPRDGIEAP
ncbi:TetR/AcrR family transcriptional regulator [Gordonia sp. NPDC003376]